MEPSDTPPSTRPFAISVVIPALNEEDSIRTLLTGVLNQSLMPVEVIITDGGSTDSTRDIIEEFIAAGAPVRLICVTKSMPGRARNLAAREVKTDWIAFTDAGITLTRDWLAALETKAAEKSADVVYGTYEPVTKSFFTECAAIAYVPPPFATDDGFVRPRSIASALVRRGAWESVGGFPEELRSAEDLLFMNSVEQAGFVTARTAGALVYWQIQTGFGPTFTRFVEYSRNNIRAGLFHEWQRTIFINYLLIAASTLSVFLIGMPGLLAPVILWFALLVARAGKALYRNRAAYPASLPRNLMRLAMLLPIIATLEAAALVGSLEWLLRDKLGLLGASAYDSRR